MNTLTTQLNHQQQGAVLILALILLVVLTILGISAIEATKLETKMAANTKNYNRAFQHAEEGISETVDFYVSNPAIKKPGIELTTLEEAHKEDNVEYPVDIDDSITEIKVMAPGKAISQGSIAWQPILVESTGKLKRNKNIRVKIVAGLVKPVPGGDPFKGHGAEENQGGIGALSDFANLPGSSGNQQPPEEEDDNQNNPST
ncbi:MAG: PilX N-terminal domain-containing pilus assembly protein [Pseudomonadota bacterium]|nr:PilX N-terminal domain-containing pilus assembly protein [Pseudomonadota bacterium]